MSATEPAAGPAAWPVALPSPWRSGLALMGVLTIAFVALGNPGAGTLLPVADPAARSMLLLAAAAVTTSVLCASGFERRLDALAGGAAALGALAAVMVAPGAPAVAALLLVLAALHGSLPGRRPFAARWRGPVLAALLLGVGWILTRSGAPIIGRVGALGLALSVAAVAGVLPYVPDFDREEPAAASSLAWTALFAPVLVVAEAGRIPAGLDRDELALFAAALLAMGLINLAWGGIWAWRAADLADSWRASFIADWGLALVGIGLASGGAAGPARRGAFLILAAVVATRMPLYGWARPVLRGGRPAALGPANIVLGLILAGAAPFAGFTARLDLLRAANGVSWPLEAVLLAGMLLWIGSSFRLAPTLGVADRRRAVGNGLVIAASLALGLAPAALFGAAT